MKLNRQMRRGLNHARGTMYDVGKAAKHAGKAARGMSKAALAGAAGIALMIGNFGRSMRDKATDWDRFAARKKSSKSGEGVTMKKSTIIALLVALAAVAGVLGALYVYVLRREKELDEYEQLLFGEEFDDEGDFLPEEMDEPAPKAPAKAAKADA